MTISEYEQLQAVITELEQIQNEASAFDKATYSQGRAKPGIGRQLQAVILGLRAVLDNRSEETVTHTTNLVTSNEAGEVVVETLNKLVQSNATKRR